MVDAAVSTWGRLDGLVNNAGVTEFIPLHDIEAVTPEIWRRILDVNVVGTWQLIAAALPHLRAAAPGRIVNMASIAGIRPVGSSAPYSVSKAAVVQMTELLGKALGPHVLVNAVAPGLIDTPWTAPWTEAREDIPMVAPLGRLGLADRGRRPVRTPAERDLHDGRVHLDRRWAPARQIGGVCSAATRRDSPQPRPCRVG